MGGPIRGPVPLEVGRPVDLGHDLVLRGVGDHDHGVRCSGVDVAGMAGDGPWPTTSTAAGLFERAMGQRQRIASPGALQRDRRWCGQVCHPYHEDVLERWAELHGHPGGADVLLVRDRQVFLSVGDVQTVASPGDEQLTSWRPRRERFAVGHPGL